MKRFRDIIIGEPIDEKQQWRNDLDNIPLYFIEQYLREKKLEKLKKAK